MSERTYKLLDGSELICSEEGILSHRLEPDFTAITTDPNAEYMDLLALIDSLQQQVNGLNEESLANFQTAAERGKQIAEKDWTIKQLESVRDQLKTWLGECGTERDALREQLAERDAVIRRLTYKLEEARQALGGGKG